MTVSSDPILTSHIDHRRGVILVLLAGAFWSIAGLVVRLVESATVWQILLYRSLSLTVFLFLVLWIRTGGHPLAIFLKAGRSSVYGGLALGVAFFGAIAAMQHTTVANAMFLFATAPFITALLAIPLLGEWPRRATLIAMLFAAIGVTVMVTEGISLGNGFGNFLACFSALGFALFSIALRWGRSEDMLPTVVLAGVFSSIVAAIACEITGEGFKISQHDAFLSITLGIVQLGIGLFLYTLGSKVVPAGELTLLSMTEVLLGPFWVWLFLSETASFWTWLGGGILLTAIAGNALTQLRHKPPPLTM